MRSPQPFLGDRIPAVLLMEGREDEVERLLGQILEGAYL